MTSPTEASRRILQPLENARVPWWKRSIDLVWCVAALPFFLCAAVLVAALASLNSPGPIFFIQERIGYRGQKFRLYKFRTMHLHAESTRHQLHFAELVSSNAPMQKLDAKGDVRLIPGGSWLRATGIDELPQIINVLRGEMSLVGPRPCIPYEYNQYSARQRDRFATVPGLTGLWQVSGKKRTTLDEMIRLDIEYAHRRSLWLDLGIILGTLPAIVLQVWDQRRVRKNVRVAATFSPGPSVPLPQTAR